MGVRLKIDGRWEIGPTNKCEMGSWTPKKVGDERLRPLPTITGGKCVMDPLILEKEN